MTTMWSCSTIYQRRATILFARLLRRLADFKPVDAPVLSISLDMRPHTNGRRPALRDHYPVSAHDVAIFACSAARRFEEVEAGVPFAFQASVGNAPDLFFSWRASWTTREPPSQAS